MIEDDIVVTKKKTAKKTAVAKKKAAVKSATSPTLKKVAKKAVSKKKAVTKKAATRKTAKRARISFEQRYQKIEEAAYLIAEKSSFEPGNEVRNWLLAEQQIDAWIAADNIELVR